MLMRGFMPVLSLSMRVPELVYAGGPSGPSSAPQLGEDQRQVSLLVPQGHIAQATGMYPIPLTINYDRLRS